MTTTSKKTVKRTPKFDYKKIKTFEDACKKLNVDPSRLPDVSGITGEFAKPITAVYKLYIIYKAINNGWTPDWSNRRQDKYYPWFWVSSSGFGFSGAGYFFDLTDSPVGSRLCTDSSEKALYIAKQFSAEFQEFLLYSE
jgi:hypothetical protein